MMKRREKRTILMSVGIFLKKVKVERIKDKGWSWGLGMGAESLTRFARGLLGDQSLPLWVPCLLGLKLGWCSRW